MDESFVLSVEDLRTYFFTRKGADRAVVKAVNGVSFSLRKGSTLGIVGESGCGKTVTALSILKLVPFPGKTVGGRVNFEGRDLLSLGDEEMRDIRGKKIAIIFQDPMTGLNPVLPVGSQVEEMITSHTSLRGREARETAIEALEQLGMPSASKLVSSYPFQLSGGMCQRVMIAMALVLNPEIVIADEPTTALDVTLQAELLERIRRLKEERRMSVVLITHDMGVIAHTADDVAVMYAGSIAEHTDTVTLFKRPTHPYTWALLEALPRLDRPKKGLRTIKGSPPDLVDMPDQCAFLPRCIKAVTECRISPAPSLKEIAPNHLVACYNPMRHD
ncbi:MAG: ABC transporter ATP-binding protein [Chloroflexi bacterium]|nr:ABC transporter ATP-binding protein [Chloroflexota bacterium]